MMDLSTTLWLISFFVVFLGLSGYGIHRYSIIFLFLKHHRRHPQPKRKFAELPAVTVQLPLFNELHVVERLLRKVSQMDYPKEKLQIQVLDDSTDESVEIAQREVARLQADGFDVEYRHRIDRTGFKAGALEEGLATAKGEFIFILDADFIPARDILHRMIHHFTDEKVGMIQTRWGHINRDYSLLTRIQAMFLDGHLLLEQTARSRSGRFFNFNGTAGIWRKSTIADAGGWQHDTLTEDLDLSYRAQLRGWRFVFLSDVVTPAELPVDMNGFKSQQHRWTKGSVQTCKKMLAHVWRSDSPLLVKLEATAHLTSNFAYLLLVFLCVLMFPISLTETVIPSFVIFFLSWLVFVLATLSVIAFYITAQCALHPKTWWKEMVHMPMLMALGIGMSINNGKAVLEAIFNQKSAFIRTPKYGVERQRVAWQQSNYKAFKKNFPVFIEFCLAFYFTALVAHAIWSASWQSLPFLGLFMVGFYYVGLGSIPPLLLQALSPEPKNDGKLGSSI
ncbi:MAG: glycosyltransferase [Verrucomicrobiota bacterium]